MGDASTSPFSATYPLPPDTSSARLARQLAREALGGRPAHVVEIVELLVSELVANAVRHTGSAPVMHIESGDDRLQVSVTDQSPAAPCPQRPSHEVAGGRGLQLVDALAESWGWTAAPDGKRVWFTI